MSQAQENTRIRPARPTIIVAGQEDAALQAGLLELLVVETTAGLYRCEARFGNWGQRGGGLGPLYLDRRKLDFGKALTLGLGDDTIFEGRITALDGHFLEGAAPEITVLAEDRLEKLRAVRRTRTFADVADADVIQQIAGEHGLQADVGVTGPTHRALAQLNQSDLAFLRERARAVDAEVWVTGSTLHAQPRGSRDGGTLELRYGKDLLEISVLADLAEQRSSVTVGGWDVSAKQAIAEKADASVMGGELGSDTSGASILAQAFEARDEVVAHRAPATAEEARARAEAELRLRARRFVVGRGRAQASGKLRVGSFVKLSGLAPVFDGKYYLAEVRHLFDGAKGVRTEFIAERPGLGPTS